MEPITASLIGSVISGVVGNRADHVFCLVMQSVRERLRQGGKPVNHDLQKATRKAYLQATLALINARLIELNVAPSLLQRDLRHLFRLPNEPSQLLKARGEILRELKQLPKAAYIPPSSEAEQQLELLLQPRGETAAQQRVADLKAQLKAQLQQELRDKWGVEPSDRLIDMLQNGWQEREQGNPITLDWFDLLCAFFAEELKQNQRVANIFQSQLLANLSEEEASIDYSAFTHQLEQFAGQALTWLQQIKQELAQMRQEQAEGFQWIQQRLDEYLPTLLTGMEQLQTLLQALQEEAQRRPLYEKYAGLELTQRTEKVVCDHTALFVGREQELEQLDAMFGQPSGARVITALAGYGKTALLANWIDQRHRNGCFIARHFFRREYDDANRLDSLPNALYNLLRQLYIYYGVERDMPPRDEEGLLRDAILGLLQEQRGARDDEPLVLLLDGLDEAEKPLLLTLPTPLPEGVYLVVSIRADEAETPAALRPWLSAGAQRLHLQTLPRSAVIDYLARTGDGELAPWTQGENFVNQVMQKTEGYPLHLRFLADDLLQAARAGGDVRAVLRDTPRGFDNYVRAQLSRLAQSLTNAPKVQRLFALLATALGALSEGEIETLAGLNAFDMSALPREATRWFSITERDGDRFYAFTHPILGDAFEHTLGTLARRLRQQLLDYCARWGEHRSPYALRHYATHLKEAGDDDALYNLARDEAFLQAQRDALPAEPDLPLRTLQTALNAAISQENAPVIAEMLLRHVHRTAPAETPLDAMRQGNLERAIGLAKQLMERDYEVGTLWLLLLAWNRRLAGDTAGAERCMAEATEWWEGRTLEKLSGWQAEAAVFLLTPLSDLPSAPTVAGQTLGDGDLKLLLPRPRWAQVGAFAPVIWFAFYRSEALVGVAQALAQAGIREAALWQHLIQIAQQIERAFYRSGVLAGIAQALAQAGEMEQAQQVLQHALTAVQQIERAEARSEALVGVAQALAQAGEMEQAQQVLQHALTAVQQIERAEARSEALVGVAQALAQAGIREAALWQHLIQIAQQIEEASDRSGVLVGVAQALAQAGIREAALWQHLIQIAQQIEEASDRSGVLAGIAQALAQAGEVEQAQQVLQHALTAAQQIEEAFYRSEGLVWVAQALAQAGIREAALWQHLIQIAQQIEEAFYRSEGLAGIAQALAQAGEVEQAQQVLQHALTAAQQIGWAEACSEALVGVAQAMAQAGEVEQAQQVLQHALTAAQQIGWAEARSRALVGVAQAMAQAGEMEQAQQVLQHALTAAQQIEEPFDRDRSEALAGVAQAMAQAGEMEQAQQVLQHALTAAQQIEEPFDRDRSEALVGVAQALAQAGIREAALWQHLIQIAQQIEEAFYRSEGLAGIAQALAQAGIREAALWQHLIQIAQQIEEAFDRSKVLAGVAQALAQAGEVEQAQQVLQHALTAAQQIGWAEARSRALAGVAQAMAQAGEMEQAQQVLQHALTAAQQIEEPFDRDRSEALAGIAQALAQAGIREAALWQHLIQIAQQIEEASDRSEGLAGIAQAMAQAGEMEQAQQVLQHALTAAQQIEGAFFRSEALVGVAQALAQAGIREHARSALQKAWEAAHAARRFSALWTVAITAAQEGFDDLAVDYAQQIAGARSRGLPGVLNALTKRGAKGAFLALLPLCAWEMTTALRACACLVSFYPAQAPEIQVRAWV